VTGQLHRNALRHSSPYEVAESSPPALSVREPPHVPRSPLCHISLAFAVSRSRASRRQECGQRAAVDSNGESDYRLALPLVRSRDSIDLKTPVSEAAPHRRATCECGPADLSVWLTVTRNPQQSRHRI
jgi:hypothetical protein